MEYCEKTLAARIAEDKKEMELHVTPIPFSVVEQKWSSASTIMNDITNGVVYIHNCGLVHRDLKPSNGKGFDKATNCSFIFEQTKLLADHGFRFHI
jgi:hypothetical protein